MRRRRKVRLLTAAGIVVAVAGGAAGHADAGDVIVTGSVDVRVSVRGPDAAAVRAGITFELYEESGGTEISAACDAEADEPAAGPLTRAFGLQCGGLSTGDYTVGLDGVPEGWSVSAFCQSLLQQQERITSGTPTFTIDFETRFWNCDISVYTPVLAVDKIVDGGDATVAEFPIEVYDDEGAQVDVGAVTDPESATCTSALTECLLIALPPGQFQLGEVLPEYGYDIDAAAVVCDSFINLESYFDELPLNERIDSDSALFDTGDGDAYCSITNPLREGQLVVTATVTNDEGGTATPEDIAIEVFDAAGGEIVAATSCAADGSCLDVMLPIGDYVIGYVGPAGYTREVTQAVSDPAPEQITDDPDAEFSLIAGRLVEIVVEIDDPTPPTTTTTTTTTLAPTTTALDAGVATLPATGTSAGTNVLMSLVALALLAAGGALVAVRRTAR